MLVGISVIVDYLPDAPVIISKGKNSFKYFQNLKFPNQSSVISAKTCCHLAQPVL